MDNATTFRFGRQDLQARATSLAEGFQSGDPFPHVVFRDLVPDEVLLRVADEFPETGWEQFQNTNEVKLALSDESLMGPATRSLIHELNSQVFIEFLSRVTGISALVPDPYLFGGGLHQIRAGGLLKIHSDFNRHVTTGLDRRLNLLVYLNADWPEEYGGHLELWSTDMAKPVQRILPTLGTCVLFATTDTSPHGHPDPLRCPEDRSRRSIAMYYYTNGRPSEERSAAHSTLFKYRPGEKFRLGTRRVAKVLTPPILPMIARRILSRLTTKAESGESSRRR